MRLCGLFLLVLVACTEHGQGGAVVCRFDGATHHPGDFFSAGDGCNSCECLDEGGRGRVTCSTNVCTDGGVPDAIVEPPPPEPDPGPVDGGGL